MSKYEIFEFTPELIEEFRENKEIPVHFYNHEGQILIYKKEGASEQEIERILKFVDQGIYYDVEDQEKLGIKSNKRDIPDGLSDVKLLSESAADELLGMSTDLFDTLRKTSLTSVQARQSSQKLAEIFEEFDNQPEAMSGLVNIIGLMQGKNASIDNEMAIKRTVVAMALKTRGMHAQNSREERKMQEIVGITMQSAMLCDVGTARMKMPEGASISVEEMKYVQNHPLMSYMLIAHEPAIEEEVKFNVLHHHRPMREGVRSNNYPETPVLIRKLQSLAEKYTDEPSRSALGANLQKQLQQLARDTIFHEDVNILSIASEFASLTTRTPWRPEFDALEAVRMLINNSFYTYPIRIIHEFLDYVAISLCDNRKIINEGDIIITAGKDIKEQAFFEACHVSEIGRYQSRPLVKRLATVFPETLAHPKIKLVNFESKDLRPDPRHAHYDLSKDDSRQIVYYVDPEKDVQFHERLMHLV